MGLVHSDQPACSLYDERSFHPLAQAYVGGNQWKMQIIWRVIGFSLFLRFQSWIIIFG